MERSEIHQETGEAWNLTAAIYERDEAEDIAFLRGGGVSMLPPERRYLEGLGSWCGRAIHLQCAGGKDTLSLWNLGAAEIVGVDISPRMIASARRKMEALGAPASWYCTDILKTPSALDGSADLVYTGRGALPWMMDITAWAAVVFRLLKPGGRLYVFEGHPLDWVWDKEAATYKLDEINGSYFSEALNDRRWPAPFLADLDTEASTLPCAREHQWTLGAIMNSLVEAGLRLLRFEEHPDLYWNEYPNLPDALAARLPHTFSLWMQKD